MMKAAWHGVSDSSVVNDPLEGPRNTPLYVGLPSAWGSEHGDRMFFSLFVRELLS